MNQLILVIGALYGLLAVVLGAFGAHALKKIWPDEVLKNFETGVRYQMYHGLLLVILGSTLLFESPLQQVMGICIILGTFLFSGSIYLLCWGSSSGKKPRLLGPVTPLGGLLLVFGWALLVWIYLS